MFAYNILDGLNTLDFITEKYSLGHDIVCAEAGNGVEFSICNKADKKMFLSIFQGTKHLLDKEYDIKDTDTLLTDIENHYLVLS